LKDIPLHRRQWRSQSYNAQLHPPIAAAMAKIAIATNNSTFIDPFCGSGTILIEAALQKNELNYIGFDTERSAIQIATENSRLANTRIAFYNANFYNSFNDMEDYFIISNPPWGEKHLIDSESEEIFIKKLIEIISKSRGALLLIPKEINQKILDKGMKGEEKFQTRIRGKLVSIFHFK
jgi:23S rRNA G2445 N2-methylase RlmL